MNFRQAIHELGRPRDWGEAVRSFVDEHGRAASRWIAEKFGVSQRTAQKWIKGTQAPATRGDRRDKVRRAGVRNKIAARAIRDAQIIDAGEVEVLVRSTGRPDGTRTIGALDVDDELRRELGEVAELVAAGDLDGAELAMSDALLGGYAAAKGDNRDVARGALLIYDYPDGLEIV